MSALVSTPATTQTATGSSVSTEHLWPTVSSTLGDNNMTVTENTIVTVRSGSMTSVETTSMMTNNVKPQDNTVFSASTEGNVTDATNTTETAMVNVSTTQMAKLNGTTTEMTINNTTTTLLNATTTSLVTTPTTLSSSTSSANWIESITMTTITSQTGSTSEAKPSTSATTPRTSTRGTTSGVFPSTAPPPTVTTYPASQTTWSVPSRGLGTTTTSPRLLSDKNIYIGAGAIAAGVMLVIILASIFCSRRRKHSKCRKLAVDDGNINAYEVEMASRLGEDNIGATLVESDDPADDKPEIRNYFQDGLRSEENNSNTGDEEAPERRAAPPSGIKTEDRLSVGPVMLSDSSGSTQETYDRAYSTHDTFKSW